jgi:hypothetical protein
VKAKDTCTDPGCFEAKTSGRGAIKVEEYRAAGQAGNHRRRPRSKIIGEGRGASRRATSSWTLSCYDDEKERNYRQLLGKACPEVVLVEKPGTPGEFLELVPEKEAREALAKKYPALGRRSRGASARRAPTTPISSSRRKPAFNVHLALREVIGRDGFTNADLIEIGVSQLEYGGGVDEDLAPHWGLPKEHDPDLARGEAARGQRSRSSCRCCSTCCCRRRIRITSKRTIAWRRCTALT